MNIKNTVLSVSGFLLGFLLSASILLVLSYLLGFLTLKAA